MTKDGRNGDGEAPMAKKEKPPKPDRDMPNTPEELAKGLFRVADRKLAAKKASKTPPPPKETKG